MIKFGTDGWRDIISDNFTFKNVRIVSQAIADYFNEITENPSIVVGYDTRFLSRKYAQLVSEVMAGNKINVIFSDRPSPTPMTSYCIKSNDLTGGVMITASHNPAEFNGIKVKANYAGSATPEITDRIEQNLNKKKPVIKDFKQAKEERLVNVNNISENYIKFIRSYLDLELFEESNFDFKVAVDVMYGTANHFFDMILENKGLTFKILHGDINPSFGNINPEPIPENLKQLSEELRKGNYDIGIAVDGDSDRVGAMTSEGEFITPGWILSMLLLHYIEDKGKSGKVVKTISNSSLIEKIAQKYNLELEETPVGFKHICKIMQEDEVMLGGEESGGIGFSNYIPERDGILAGLLLLEMIAYKGENISEIKREVEEEYGKYEYSRIDLKYPEEKKKPLFEKLDKEPFKKLKGIKIINVKSYDGRKFICKDDSWLLFRLSGTEPKLRVYSEAHSKERVDELLQFGKKYALNI